MVIGIQELPQKIKELRGEQSQEAFAGRFGVTRQLVSQWETGAAVPGAKHLREMNIEKVFLIADSV